MAHDLLYVVDGYALGDEPGGVGVPQVVEPQATGAGPTCDVGNHVPQW